ncbi:vacuolar aminopeptidase 1 [Ciborinia camelliae]|nr:vacuolar aminopeptidase 1 [Ciborinia camelliae]
MAKNKPSTSSLQTTPIAPPSIPTTMPQELPIRTIRTTPVVRRTGISLNVPQELPIRSLGAEAGPGISKSGTPNVKVLYQEPLARPGESFPESFAPFSYIDEKGHLQRLGDDTMGRETEPSKVYEGPSFVEYINQADSWEERQNRIRDVKISEASMQAVRKRWEEQDRKNELIEKARQARRSRSSLSSSIENEQRLEETWAQTFPNSTPAVEFSKQSSAEGTLTTLYEMMSKRLLQHSSVETENTHANCEETLFQRYHESMQNHGKSLIGNGMRNVARDQMRQMRLKNQLRLHEPEEYAEPFINFMTENPTIWHAIQYWENKLEKAGFVKLSPRESWNDKLKPNGKYYLNRNGTSLIAFVVGGAYTSGNGIAMVAAHSDSLTARLKPVSAKNNKAGYVQLGVAPYAGALNETWWDRDLGIGGRVLVKDEKTGSISQQLVKLDWPIARIPSLAPHFGVGMFGQNNKETQVVPIIGLDNSDIESSASSSSSSKEFQTSSILGAKSSFVSTQPPKLVNLIAKQLGIENEENIINWELELFDTQPAQLGGLDKEFIFSGRIDDKVCSWSSIEALLASSVSDESKSSGIISMVALFDDEEIGSLLRQGANGNFLPGTVERIVESFNDSTYSPNILMETYAKSYLVSFDVTHAANPNFLEKYLENHAPRLNVGLTVTTDSNGHTTSDSVSTAIFQRLAEKSGQQLQTFMIRNDSRSGGTVGPMLSSKMGVRAIDVGIPQLSMHSVRATTGSLDPGLGVQMINAVFGGWEAVDAEFAAGDGW